MRTCQYPTPCLNGGVCTNTSAFDAKPLYTCDCPQHFSGVGCQNFDACSEEPCRNGGNCSLDFLSPMQFICACQEGTDGLTCESILPPCASSPCANRGVCSNGDDASGEFDCLCLPGFSGDTCETDTDECAPNPCSNGGSCIDGVNSFSCLCLPEFSGPTCETQVVFCAASACGNGGSCVEESDGFSCMCSPGWTGDQCLENINECETTVCENSGTCVDTAGSFLCLCSQGFTGPDCSEEIDFCAGNLCSGNGNCTSSPSGATCSCRAGFTGPQCAEDIDECTLEPCSNGATCVDGIDHFTCICVVGFSGMSCETNLDDCASQPCFNGGSCSDRLASFSCTCNVGFTGTTCETQFDFCINSPCLSGGTCSSTATSFQCECPPGISGNRCQYVDSVEAKLALCGVGGAIDILSDTAPLSGLVSFSATSPPVATSFSLSSTLFFSAWVWQEEETSGTLLHYTDTTETVSQVDVVSDLLSRQIVLNYTIPGLSQTVVFPNVELIGSRWQHLSLLISNSTTQIAIEGRSFYELVTPDLPIPSHINLTVGSGGFGDQFIGIMRGAAISDGVVDLATVESCTVACIGGEGLCLNGDQCLDQFSEQYLCSCSFGFMGPFCQYPNTRVSFEEGGIAVAPPTQEAPTSVQFEFKSASDGGHLVSQTTPSLQLSSRLNVTAVDITITYCDSSENTHFVSPSSSSLGDLQWHSVALTRSPTSLFVQLDETTSHSIPLRSPNCSNTAPFILTLGGEAPIDGCIRDVSLDASPLPLSQVQLSSGAQLGCRRDTAQFFGASYHRLPEFISRASQVISFDFNSRTSDGVIYYSRRRPTDATGSNPTDFIALHLSSNHLSFSFNLGQETVTVTSQREVSDGAWHHAEAALNGTMATLTVDGEGQQDSSTGPLALLDTTGNVLLGSVPSEERVASFSGYADYSGCVRDLEQNGVAVDLLTSVASWNVRFGTCN